VTSALYVGRLRHRRFAPKPHDFTYPLFMAYLDIDRLPQLMQISRVSSYNRWNWAAFDERDHFGDPKRPLRERLRQDAARHGLELPDGSVFLLTHLRYLGYNFNPVSFFYCYDSGGTLRMVLAEVNNTFGETYNYWLHDDFRQPGENSFRYRTPKVFHVSPFMEIENVEYTWTFTEPGDALTVHMQDLENGRMFFDATLMLERRPWNAVELRRVLFRHPFMTAKVITAIHWQALLLFLKRVPFFRHPRVLGRPHPAVDAVTARRRQPV
jgi:DUF1365 family protein